MAKVGQLCYDVAGYTTPDIDFTADLVTEVGATRFTSLAVQAPSGTMMTLNGKSIMVGRTGIYELTDGIVITSMVLAVTSDLEEVIIDYLYE